MPTWGRKGTQERLVHLLVLLGLRCYSVFSYLGISNSVISNSDTAGWRLWVPSLTLLWTLWHPRQATGKALLPTEELPILSPCFLPKTELLRFPDPGRHWLSASSACSVLPKLQIRLIHGLTSVCWGIESCVGWVWSSKVGFGGCCELTWLEAVLQCHHTKPIWTGTAWRDEVRQRQGHSQHGRISASGSCPPQCPHRDLRQQVKVCGVRDLSFHSIAHLFLGLGDRWGPEVREPCSGLLIACCTQACHGHLILKSCSLMLYKPLLSADFSEQLHYALLALGFTCAELSRARLPVMLTATSRRVWLELSLKEEMPLPASSKWRCRNEFSCWAPTGVRKSRKFSKICNFACCYQH